jgi:cbb3-type cytochrome c oxidase subunit III
MPQRPSLPGSRRLASPSIKAFSCLGVALCLAGCQVDLERMLDQHKAKAYRESPFFEDGQSMRRPPRNTVPVTRVTRAPELTTGMRGGAYTSTIPLPLDAEALRRGQDRFRIFCRTCHGPLGDGQSQVAENMKLRRPPSLHEPRIVSFPPGQLFRIISEGYGLMPSYADVLPIRDRWAVVAFVRALQLSQDVALSDLPEDLRKEAQPWL